MENVHTLPTKSEVIAKKIHQAITGLHKADADWRENAIALCEQVAAAKTLYPRTKEFGAWWDAQDFGLNADTRAALVAMGQDIGRAREVLAVTDRRSIEQVYRNDFQLRDIPKSPATKEPKNPKRRTQAGKTAEAIITQIKETGAPIPTTREVSEQFGIQGRQAAHAIDQVNTYLAVAGDEEPVVDPETLPPDWKAKYDIAVSQMKKKAERELKEQLKKMQDMYHDMLRAEVREYNNRLHPGWVRQIKFAESYEERAPEQNYQFTKEQFRDLKFFTHPDKVAAELKERASAIFTILSSKEKYLVRPTPPAAADDKFPDTPDGLWEYANKKKRTRKSQK
jgi:hypothetical protein